MRAVCGRRAYFPAHHLGQTPVLGRPGERIAGLCWLPLQTGQETHARSAACFPLGKATLLLAPRRRGRKPMIYIIWLMVGQIAAGIAEGQGCHWKWRLSNPNVPSTADRRSLGRREVHPWSRVWEHSTFPAKPGATRCLCDGNMPPSVRRTRSKLGAHDL